MDSHDNLIIDTPEQTSLEFPLAGIGSRFLAMAADTAIQAGLGLLIFIVLLILLPGFRLVGMAGAQWILALFVIAGFLRDCVEWPDSGKALRPTARDERRWPSHQRL